MAATSSLARRPVRLTLESSAAGHRRAPFLWSRDNLPRIGRWALKNRRDISQQAMPSSWTIDAQRSLFFCPGWRPRTNCIVGAAVTQRSQARIAPVLGAWAWQVLRERQGRLEAYLEKKGKIIDERIKGCVSNAKRLRETLHEYQEQREEEEKLALEDPAIASRKWTIPNLITVARMVATPYLGYLIATGEYQPAFIGFLLAGLSDAADGHIARTFKSQRSTLGSFLDPLADKFLMGDAGLIVGTFLYRYTTMKETKLPFVILCMPSLVLSQLWNILCSLSTKVEVTPSVSSKLNTAGQIALVLSALAANALSIDLDAFISTLSVATAATTFLSGYDYYKRGAAATIKKTKLNKEYIKRILKGGKKSSSSTD